tara:strand:- start:3543 stop:4598 length:1056 start_codon:yes stop_codon:yes gene_type:complete
MKSFLLTAVVAIAIAITPSAFAADAQSILDEVMAKDIERKKGVQSYSIRQNVMGQSVVQYFERIEVELSDGSKTETFRMVPASEMQGRSNAGGLTPAQAEAYAQGAEMTGEALSSEMEKGMQNAGLPPGLLSGMGSSSEPWASPDPKVMMSANADFVRAAGKASAQGSDGRKNAEEAANQMAQFAETAKLVGTESVNGVDAFHLRSDGIQMSDTSGGQDFEIDTYSIWIDTDNYVPVRMRMEGTASEGGQQRDVYIEQQWLDYRQVPNSNMYESYKRVSRMGGVMSPAEEKQMAEARQQMAEFEKQLAAMPESQRKMMESMMGSRMDSIRKMVSTGGYEVETNIEEILVIM